MSLLRVLAFAAMAVVPLLLLVAVLWSVAASTAQLANGAGWWALCALAWPALVVWLGR